ncbi:MAG: 3-phosphoshikimate 1-carboxyvinyltransferase [Wolinella sp.]
MRITQISPKSKSFELEINTIATDKSISHRCAIFSLLAKKPSRIHGFLEGEDTLNTLKIAQKLGLGVALEGDSLILTPPRNGIIEPDDILDCGNAGTAMRLYTGLLSAIKGYFVLSGDSYLRKRPMRRIVDPLRSIGANIFGRDGGELAPLSIIGAPLKSFDYTSPIASAQVKSALILAAMHGESPSYFSEPELSRDHTERMLQGMGAEITTKEGKITIMPLCGDKLSPLELTIPADPSSAFFLAVAAAITPGAKVLLKSVLLNPTRIEGFRALERMGAKISYQITSQTYESIGDIEVVHASLRGIDITERLSWLIDELPALAVAMALAKGKSRVQNAKELRAKESDRIRVVVGNLQKLGIEAVELDDGYEITGGSFAAMQTLESHGDHRIAMSFALVGLCVPVRILDSGCMDVSFPNFLHILAQIAKVEHESQARG